MAIRTLAYTGAICLGAGVTASLLIPRSPSPELWVTFVLVGASVLALLAGATALVTWRVLGDVSSARYGTGMLSLGLLTLARTALQGHTVAAIRAPLQPLDEVVVGVVAGGLLWQAIVTSNRSAGFAFLPTLITRLAVGLLALGALYALWVTRLLPPRRTGLLDDVITAFAAGIWLSIAAAGIWRERRHRWPALWTGAVPGLIGIGGCLEAVHRPSPALLLASSVVVFLAVSLAFGIELTRLDASLWTEDWQKRDLSRILRVTQRRVRRQHEQLEEWLHDVRNAVAGLRSVDAVLRGGFGRDLADHIAIVDAVSAELVQLESLLDPALTARASEVDLADVVVPAAAAERLSGARIDVRDVEARVWADARSLARVLQNVLVNARRYAPGSLLCIWATTHSGRVELRVRDQGPGIPVAEHESVFERGERGTSSRGTLGDGLGLSTARALLRATGGEIDVDAGVQPGCCIRITLPSAGDTRAEMATDERTWESALDRLGRAV